MDVKGEEF